MKLQKIVMINDSYFLSQCQPKIKEWLGPLLGRWQGRKMQEIQMDNYGAAPL